MNKARALRRIESQRIEHSVNMTLGLGTSLHRKSGGLVQHKDGFILMNDKRPDEGSILLADAAICFGRGFGRLITQRRHTHNLPLLQPHIRLCPRTIHTHLPCTQKLFEAAMRYQREMPPEPSIQPKPIFIIRDCDLRNFVHTDNIAFTRKRPRKSAPMPIATEPPI